MNMKTDFTGLIGRAASAMARKDAGTAYALYELADNLAMVLRNDVSLDDFREAYVGQDAKPFIREGLMPGEKGYKDHS